MDGVTRHDVKHALKLLHGALQGLAPRGDVVEQVLHLNGGAPNAGTRLGLRGVPRLGRHHVANKVRGPFGREGGGAGGRAMDSAEVRGRGGGGACAPGSG